MFAFLNLIFGSITVHISIQAVSVSTVSNNGALSSCISRLYANGNDFIRVKRVVRLPMAVAVFPLISSGTSGFFFWGMILLPVAKESGNYMKLNSEVDHKISSSDSRLK